MNIVKSTLDYASKITKPTNLFLKKYQKIKLKNLLINKKFDLNPNGIYKILIYCKIFKEKDTDPYFMENSFSVKHKSISNVHFDYDYMLNNFNKNIQHEHNWRNKYCGTQKYYEVEETYLRQYLHNESDLYFEIHCGNIIIKHIDQNMEDLD